MGLCLKQREVVEIDFRLRCQVTKHVLSHNGRLMLCMSYRL